MRDPNQATPPSDLILYQTEDGKTRIQCRFEDDNLWLTQAQIGELYQKDVKTINEHLLNIYEEKELAESSTIRKFRIVQQEGSRTVSRGVDHYNLDAISPRLFESDFDKVIKAVEAVGSASGQPGEDS